VDETTLSVKAMYEEYPYPTGGIMMRSGCDVNLLLSHVEKSRKTSGPMYALDAGCGRGVGVIGAAMLQPNIQFIGADMNTTALKDAKKTAEERNINNVKFVEANLMTLEGIEVPPGGFDVIYSSGVLHHLSDPLVGLKNLEKILAPHGVISLMLYGSYGRQALYRFIEGIDILMPDEKTIKERLPYTRLMSQAAGQSLFKNNYWQDTDKVNDVEFVDRCLNVNEVSYDIDSLWELIDKADMHFIRWDNIAEWSIEHLFTAPHLLNKLRQLTPKDQFKIIERMFERPRLELLISKKDNPRRLPVPINMIHKLNFSVTPEVSFSVEKRNLNGFQRIESISYKLKANESLRITDNAVAKAALLLVDQDRLFTGQELIFALKDNGLSQTDAINALIKLLQLEIVYCPH